MHLTESYIKRIQQLAGIKTDALLEESFGENYVITNYLNKGKITKEKFNEIISWDRSQNNADLPVIFKFIVDEEQDDELVKTYVEKFYNRDICRKLKNISSYKDKSFVEFTRNVDDASPINEPIPVEINKRTVEAVNKTPWAHIEDKPIFENSRYIIFHPDPYEPGAKEKCILYGGKYKYCVSRPDSTSNVYISYRKQHAATLYFVFDKRLPESDPNHIILIDVRGGDVTTESEIRNGENQLTPYGETLQSFLSVANEGVDEGEKITSSILKNKPKTAEEIELEKRLQQAYIKDTYMELNYEDKELYIDYGYMLRPEWFLNSHPNLQYKYISTGRPLGEEEIKNLSTKLKNNYLRILQRKIENRRYNFGEYDYFLANENNINIGDIGLNLLPQKNTYVVFMSLGPEHFQEGINSSIMIRVFINNQFSESQKSDIADRILNFVPSNQIYKTFSGKLEEIKKIVDFLSVEGKDFIKSLPNEHFDNIIGNIYSWYEDLSNTFIFLLEQASHEQLDSLSHRAIKKMFFTLTHSKDMEALTPFIERKKILEALNSYDIRYEIEQSEDEMEKINLLKLFAEKVKMEDKVTAHEISSVYNAVGWPNFLNYFLTEDVIGKILKYVYYDNDIKKIISKRAKGFFQKIKKLGLIDKADMQFDYLTASLSLKNKIDFIETFGSKGVKFFDDGQLQEIISSFQTTEEKIEFMKIIGRQGQVKVGKYFIMDIVETGLNSLPFLKSVKPGTYHLFFNDSYSIERLLRKISDPNDRIDLAIHMGEKTIEKLSTQTITNLLYSANDDNQVMFFKAFRDLILRKFDEHSLEGIFNACSNIFEDILKIFGNSLLYKFSPYRIEQMIRRHIKDASRATRWLNYLKIGHYYEE